MITRRQAGLLAAGLLAAPAARAAPTERSFDSAGVPIHFIEEGRGEPVILVHGYTTELNAQFVQSGIFPALAGRYRAIAFDARGHGRSGKPHDRAAYGPQMGLDAIRLMDHLGLPRAHMVGYSMGAHILAQLVTTHADRFATLTLGGAAGRHGWTAEDQRRVDIESAEMDEGSVRSQILRLSPPGAPPPSEEEIRRRSAEQMAGKDPRALAAVRRSNPDQVVTEAQMRALRVPTLGIVGTADPYLRDFQWLRGVIPNMQLVTIEGATHNTAPRRPEFVQALTAFLAAHPLTS